MREPYGWDPTLPPRSRLERLRRRQARRRRLLGYGVAAAAFVAAVSGVVAVANDDGDGATATPTKSTAGDSSGAGKDDQPSRGAGLGAAVADCRTAWRLQGASRGAAKRSLAQWRVHIEAMNKLTAKKITLEQAKQFWKQSRTGAKANAAAFRSADLQYIRSAAHCAVPPDADGDVQALGACRDAEAAAGRELRSARLAIATWEVHIQDMELLRAGKLSPNHALHMWLQNWRTGVAQLTAYDKASTASTCVL